jgi:hypothetical protein
MRTRFTLVALGAWLVVGCSHITANLEHDQYGGVWYAKETTVFGLVTESTIYHCPAPASGTGPVCHEARREDFYPASTSAPGATGPAASAQPPRPVPAGEPPCKITVYCPTGYCTGSPSCTPP